MTRATHPHQLLSIALNAGIRASAAIMEVYEKPFDFENKADGSPITIADRRSNQIITRALKRTGLPVLSEESRHASWAERQNWHEFWLIDPLDGTKEFIGRNGEFAINIALIQNNQPFAGIIVAPVSKKAWWGIAGQQAYVIDFSSFSGKINPEVMLKSSILPEPYLVSETIGMAVSRSHLEPQTLRLAEQIRQKCANFELVEKGSALKFCDLIEGRASVYARYSQTWEWDTAAGHALLLAQRGQLYQISEGHQPFLYNKKDLRNPGFIAFARKDDSAWYFSELSF